MYNYDGDLLFTCSDDGKICMYNTYDCTRVGVFNLKEACKSIDVSKDSKWLIGAATTYGVSIFSVDEGELKQKVKVPAI
jgi:WD40 repeat protein